jgi:hypothetical protein
MDAAFMPSEVVVKHFANHKLTLELGPSLISLGKPLRNLLIGGAAIYLVGRILDTVQAVLSREYRKPSA